MNRHVYGSMIALTASVLLSGCPSGLPDDDANGGDRDTDGGAASAPGLSGMDAGTPGWSGAVATEADTWARAGKRCGEYYEPNDEAAKACRIALSTKIDSQLVATTDKLDYFAFYGRKDVAYTLVVDSTTCTSGIWVQAWTAAAKEPVEKIRTSLGRAFRAFELTPDVSGEMVLAFSLGEGSCGYSFRVLPSTVAGHVHDMLHEPNDTPSIAKPLGAPRVEVSSNLSTPRDSEDYFTIDVLKDVTYTLSLSTFDCAGRVYAYGSALGSGQPVENLKSDSYRNKVDVEFKPNTTGPELLRFYLADNSCQYAFRVLPSTSAGLVHDAALEPNDTSATAAKLSSKSVSAQLSEKEDFADYYTFDAQAGVKYTLTVANPDCAPTLYLSASTLSTGVVELFSKNQYKTRASYDITPTVSGPVLLRLSIVDRSCAYTLELTP